MSKVREPTRSFAVPGSENFKITEVYAWVCTEPNGGEGLVSAQLDFLGQPTHMPLIGADKARIESMRRFAENVRNATGYPVKLVRFYSCETIEELP